MNKPSIKIIKGFMPCGIAPNEWYRPWLEANIGQQYYQWEWRLCPNDVNMIEFVFSNSEDAMLFELTWP